MKALDHSLALNKSLDQRARRTLYLLHARLGVDRSGEPDAGGL